MRQAHLPPRWKNKADPTSAQNKISATRPSSLEPFTFIPLHVFTARKYVRKEIFVQHLVLFRLFQLTANTFLCVGTLFK